MAHTAQKRGTNGVNITSTDNPHTIYTDLTGALRTFYDIVAGKASQELVQSHPNLPKTRIDGLDFIQPDPIDFSGLGHGKHILCSYRLEQRVRGHAKKLGHINVTYSKIPGKRYTPSEADYAVSDTFAYTKGSPDTHSFNLWFNTFLPGRKDTAVARKGERDRFVMNLDELISISHANPYR